MGITPWVSKKSKKMHTLKLHVVVNDTLSDKEHRLLEQVLLFLDVKSGEWICGQLNSVKKPMVILSFGINDKMDIDSNAHYLRLESLSYFLAQPLSKKAMYQKLIPIKHALAS